MLGRGWARWLEYCAGDQYHVSMDPTTQDRQLTKCSRPSNSATLATDQSPTVPPTTGASLSGCCFGPARSVRRHSPYLVPPERRLMIRDPGNSPMTGSGASRARQSTDVPTVVIARIERTASHRALVSRLLALSKDFEAGLSKEQRAKWLELEDALFEYAQRLAAACYQAGQRVRRNRRR